MSGPFLQIRLHIKLYQPAPPGRTAENDRGDTLPSSGHVRQSVTVDFGEGSGMGHSCDIAGIMTAERYKFAYVVKSAGEIPRPSGKVRSEEHTSELQSLMRISYAVFCLKKNIQQPLCRTASNSPHHIISRYH